MNRHNHTVITIAVAPKAAATMLLWKRTKASMAGLPM
jgi:hypothetical protein